MSEAMYQTPDGKSFSEADIARWCSHYERGEFPPGERSDGEVVYGRPPLSGEATVVLSIKVPAGMKRALQAKANAAGTSTSAYARAILADAALR